MKEGEKAAVRYCRWRWYWPGHCPAGDHSTPIKLLLGFLLHHSFSARYQHLSFQSYCLRAFPIWSVFAVVLLCSIWVWIFFSIGFWSLGALIVVSHRDSWVFCFWILWVSLICNGDAVFWLMAGDPDLDPVARICYEDFRHLEYVSPSSYFVLTPLLISKY